MKRTYSSILILLTSIIVFLFAYIMRTACTQIPVYGTSSTGLSAQHFDRNGAFAAADRQKEGSLMESDTENVNRAKRMMNINRISFLLFRVCRKLHITVYRPVYRWHFAITL